MTTSSSIIWTKAFWRSTSERILGTVLAVILGTGAFDVAGILNIQQWANVGKGALGAGIITLLKCLLGGLTGGGPSLGGGEVVESVAVPARDVEVVVDPDSPTDVSAGPASPLPEGTPVDVVPAEPVGYDGQGAPIYDEGP